MNPNIGTSNENGWTLLFSVIVWISIKMMWQIEHKYM